MRLIDADALHMTCRLISLSPNDARVLQHAMQTMIDTAPTIDVETVRRGHWIFDNDTYFVPTLKCSSCGFTCGLFDYNYCPNCGCRMDGET